MIAAFVLQLAAVLRPLENEPDGESCVEIPDRMVPFFGQGDRGVDNGWAAGESDDLEWLQGWCTTLREHVSAGKSVRRARIVSEPLSDYQRWSYSIAHPMVEAGEYIRWIPRRLVSSVALPGNDFYLFDDHLAVFLVYAGSGVAAHKVTSTDPADIRLCRRPDGNLLLMHSLATYPARQIYSL
ncbi:MAG: DUF6879 family protein [Pseudonocardiaceae bacterium]